MKQIKILGVLAMALTLGLAACSGQGGGDSKESGGQESTSKHVHEAAPDAPWQMNDTQHWKDCKDNDGGKAEQGSHKWVKDDSKQDVAATCSAEGKAYEKCSVCGKTRERTLSKTAHTYEQVDGADKVVWTTEPTCTEGGVGEKECTVCHAKEAVTADPLGHVYEQVDGADKVVWASEPTCEKDGVGEKECTRCHAKETVTAEALGHKFELVGDDTEPEPGKAKVRVYTCANGCGQTNLGFKATEVTDASKATLKISDDGGARFFGHPIGNSMELDDDGAAVNGADTPKVFDRTAQGDLFEYVFDLTKEQAAQLKECRLYCDAKPAAYLGGQDFWACDPTAEEWTPGYYIDADHEDETPIADYRYILYVDDKPVSFDPEIKVPVSGRGGSEPRKEYVMPYTFNLHEGTNKISLRMAGGYRSVFYNFIFRAVEKEGGSAASGLSFKWGDAIQEGSSGLDGAKFNKNATYNLKVDNVPAAGEYVITLPMMGSNGNETRTFCTSGTNHDGQGFTIAVGETAGTILVAEKTYAEVFGDSQTAWVDVAFALVDLQAGSNVITLKTNGGGYRVSINVDSNITLALAG